jgi:hypothetical protein
VCKDLNIELQVDCTLKQDYICERSLGGHIDVFNMMVLVLYTFVMVFIINLTVNGQSKYIVLYITGHKQSFNHSTTDLNPITI